MGEIANLELSASGKGRAGLWLIGAFRGQAPGAAELPVAVAKAVEILGRRSGFHGDDGQTAETALPDGTVVRLRGLGAAETFDLRAFRAWLTAGGNGARRDGSRRIAVALPEHPALRSEAAEAVWIALAGLGYAFDRFRSKPSKVRIESVLAVPPPGQRATYGATRAAAETIAASMAYARDLANTPPNEATPEWMAARARELARSAGMRIAILGPRELRRRGMGGILAVGGGSENAPRLVRLEFGKGPLTVALVGKGVTFDTGGISIKPAAGMEDMKYDKSGACTVLGIARAAAALRLPIKIRAYLPLAENMASGTAYRPGDIVRCYNGKTVDITNTDAEGRMILADALAWAAEEKPDVMFDYATLTGACVVALGNGAAGLFSPDDALSEQILDAARVTGERLWRLPLWPEYLEEMKGIHGDLRNSGSRWGGASTAAAFLAQFTGDVRRWAHFDIAGAAYIGSDRGSGEKGATGYGVAATIRVLRQLAAERPPARARRA